MPLLKRISGSFSWMDIPRPDYHYEVQKKKIQVWRGYKQDQYVKSWKDLVQTRTSWERNWWSNCWKTIRLNILATPAAVYAMLASGVDKFQLANWLTCFGLMQDCSFLLKSPDSQQCDSIQRGMWGDTYLLTWDLGSVLPVSSESVLWLLQDNSSDGILWLHNTWLGWCLPLELRVCYDKWAWDSCLSLNAVPGGHKAGCLQTLCSFIYNWTCRAGSSHDFVVCSYKFMPVVSLGKQIMYIHPASPSGCVDSAMHF